MADMAMEATPCPGSAMVTAATAGPATPIMDMAMVATPATAGQATSIMDMAAITSVMLKLSQAMADMAMEATPCPGLAMVMDMEAITSVMLSPAMEDMAMEATLGPVTVAMVIGATLMCTDLLRDLVPHMGLDTTEQETFSYFPLQLSH